MLHLTRRFALIFSVLLVLLFTEAIGQQGYNLPSVINPSPQSQAFTRYGDYPMTSYTGLTDITVPLHTISGRKLSLPITMSFHSSGRMANEENGTLGMRWTLNCGGLVTRIMKGAPDEWNSLSPFTIYDNTVPTFDELHSACPNGKILSGFPDNYYPPKYDTEFDIFSYALPNGKQGHFILKNQNGVKVPMIVPYEPLKIELFKDGTGDGFYERISITDVDGTNYIFGKVDTSTGNSIEITEDWDSQNGQLGVIPTGWYLTKIVSSDGTDEISLSYTTLYLDAYYSTQSASISDRLRNASDVFTGAPGLDPYEDYLRDFLVTYHYEQSDVIASSGPYASMVPVLNAIQYYGGSITFNYTYASARAEKLLTEMVINKGASQHKKIRFNLSRHSGETELFYLDNLWLYGEDPGLVNEKYNFSYYEPSNTYALQTSAACKDWWGYYTNCSPNLLPLQNVRILPVNFMVPDPVFRDVGFQINRDGSEDMKKLGMLKAITYPTGGETEFIYEGNKYDYAPYYTPIQNPALLEGPGLRIKEVISKPVNGGKNIHKIYKYGAYEDGRGILNKYHRPGTADFANLLATESNVMHYWTFDFTWNGQGQAGYRTRDYFSDPYIKFDFSSNLIKYDAVSEYYMEDNVPKQKTKSTYGWDYAGFDYTEELINFNITDHELPIEFTRKFSNPEWRWIKPELRNKAIYKHNINGQYDLVRKETYSYSSPIYEEAWDLPTYLHTNVVWAKNGYQYPGHYLTAKDYHNNNCSVYGYGNRKYTTSSQLLYHSLIEEFTPNGVIITEKNFDYEPTYGLLKSEELFNSKNELVKTTYSYPHNFSNIPVYQQMVDKFIISPVIETITTVNGIQTKKAVTNYYSPSSNVYVPHSIEMQTGSKPQEVIANFNRYDNMGHILEQQKANNIKEVYLWGYQSRYPVAKILNTTYDIASTYITQSVLDGATGNGDDAALRNHLDNLRNIPGALVEIYTYKPFVGTTSITDLNGRTSYYEYDLFGRLVYVRDNENNILKKYAYDYQGLCITCGAMSNANWQATGNKRAKNCEFNIAFSSIYGQSEEKDMNPASPTYNQIRWVDYIAMPGDPGYDASLYNRSEQYWVNTSTQPKCIQVAGQNTGEQEHEQQYIDPNPCNTLQHTLRWKNVGMNTNACPLPPLYTNEDLSGIYYSSICVAPEEPKPIFISVPAGQHSSPISVVEANALAYQAAQAYADQHGECAVPSITLSLINNSGEPMTITLNDVNTGQEYTLHSTGGANVDLQNFPQGVYHIYIEPVSNAGWIYYEVGCNYSIESDGEVWLQDIPLNAGCNTIIAN